MLVAILNFLQSWRRYNASLNELNQLGDRELADIGITRFGHSAGRMGQREPLKSSARCNLPKAPAPCGRFRFLAPGTRPIWTLSLVPLAAPEEACGGDKLHLGTSRPGCPP